MLPGSPRSDARRLVCGGGPGARIATLRRIASAFDAPSYSIRVSMTMTLIRQVERGDQRFHQNVGAAEAKISSGDDLCADLIEQHCQLISMTGQHCSAVRFIGGRFRRQGPAGSEDVNVCHNGSRLSGRDSMSLMDHDHSQDPLRPRAAQLPARPFQTFRAAVRARLGHVDAAPQRPERSCQRAPGQLIRPACRVHDRAPSRRLAAQPSRCAW